MTGVLYSVGVGPGDPELLTLKAARVISQAGAYAFFAKRGRPGHAVTVARAHLNPNAEELRFDFPVTVEIPHDHPDYRTALDGCYADAAAAIAARLTAGISVALLCEGDALFYGSAMYVIDRLAPPYPHEAIPGVLGMTGCWAQAGLPMTHGDDVMTVVPATLDLPALTARLAGSDATVVMKIGRNLPKLRDALAAAGRIDDAVYVERGTMPGGFVIRLAERDGSPAPYFSMVLIPGRRGVR